MIVIHAVTIATEQFLSQKVSDGFVMDAVSLFVITSINDNDTNTLLGSNSFNLRQSVSSIHTCALRRYLEFPTTMPFARWQHVLNVVT